MGVHCSCKRRQLRPHSSKSMRMNVHMRVVMALCLMSAICDVTQMGRKIWSSSEGGLSGLSLLSIEGGSDLIPGAHGWLVPVIRGAASVIRAARHGQATFIHIHDRGGMGV